MSPKGQQGNRIWDYKTPVKMSRVALLPCTTRCILIFILLNVFFSILLGCREVPVEISVMGIELIDITYSRLRHIQRLSTLVAFLSRPLPLRTIVYTVASMHDVKKVTRNSAVYSHQEVKNFRYFQHPLIISFLNCNNSVHSAPNDSQREEQLGD